jgi:hypothetical protein
MRPKFLEASAMTGLLGLKNFFGKCWLLLSIVCYFPFFSCSIRLDLASSFDREIADILLKPPYSFSSQTLAKSWFKKWLDKARQPFILGECSTILSIQWKRMA